MKDSKNNALKSRNVHIGGHRTSIRLESLMWDGIKDIAEREKCTIHELCTIINDNKSANITLTAAIRVFIMLYFRASSTEVGHAQAGHGSLNKMKTRTDQLKRSAQQIGSLH